MYYVIKVNVNGMAKYVYNGNLLVSNIGFARKFYSKTYVRRYIRTHERYKNMQYEIVFV